MALEQNLKVGQRYTFYEKRPSEPDSSIRSYRGTFLEVRNVDHREYIYVKCDYKIHNRLAISIAPLHFIQKIETLEDILQNKSNVPDDILRIIDSFV
jgi:hypothetical protein